MIRGTMEAADCVPDKPRLTNFDAEPFTIPEAELFQAMFEMPRRAREALVPAGLHPTNPAALVLWAWRVEASPFGPFQLVQARVQVRSGTRPRGLVLAAYCDQEVPARVLRERFGFPLRAAEIAFQSERDGAALQVSVGGKNALALDARDPVALDPGDVQYSVTLTLADTPRGLRLLQVEPAFQIAHARRLTPALAQFEPGLFGDARLEPYHPVSASLARGAIALPKLRYVCRPELLSFEGTEAV